MDKIYLSISPETYNVVMKGLMGMQAGESIGAINDISGQANKQRADEQKKDQETQSKVDAIRGLLSEESGGRSMEEKIKSVVDLLSPPDDQ